MYKPGNILEGRNGQDWKILQPIGEGRCCQVYRAQQVGEDIQVALKIYKEGEKYDVAQRREDILLQIVLREQGRCNNLVINDSSFTCSGRRVVIQELLDLSAKQILRYTDNAGLSLFILQRVAKDILFGLKTLHESGFIHADLKADNVMWSAQEGCMKIIDYSLSFHVDDKDVGEVQSPSYQAPETVVYTNECPKSTRLTPAIDMWSMGCLLLFLYTGQKVTGLRSSLKVMCSKCKTTGNTERCWYETKARALIERRVVEEVEAAKQLEELISKLLQCDVANRLNANDCLLHPFFQTSLKNVHEKKIPAYPTNKLKCLTLLSSIITALLPVPTYFDLLILPTCVLRLLNMMETNALTDEEEYNDICDDIKTECLKYGEIVKFIVPRSEEGKGHVYVRYSKVFGAMLAFKKLNGRSFQGRTVITTYYHHNHLEAGKLS